MLEEYFSMTITEQGELASLPLVLPGHAPDLDKLPLCASASLPTESCPISELH